MSHRTLKRVPLDFAWPANKVWKGYLNPWDEHCKKCRPCEGTGLSPDGRFLQNVWYGFDAYQLFGNFFGANILAVPSGAELTRRGFQKELVDAIERARKFGLKTLARLSDKLEEADILALVKADRLWDFTSTFSRESGWKKKEPPVIPTPDQVNAWSGQFLGHDSINCSVVIRDRCRRAGVPHVCEICKGNGALWTSPEMEKKAEEWESEEPPTGEGWQLWETVSEGSPVTPVFPSAKLLADHVAAHDLMGGKLSAEQVLRLIRQDKIEEGSMIVAVPGEGVEILAKNMMGEPSPTDWMPDKT